MHPVPGDAAYRSRSRNSSFTDNVATSLGTSSQQPPPMTFFLADEKSMEASLARSSAVQGGLRGHPKHSTYGVQSLDTISWATSQDSDDQDNNIASTRRARKTTLTKNSLQQNESVGFRSRSSSPKHAPSGSPGVSSFDLPNAGRDRDPQLTTHLFTDSPVLGSPPGSPISRQGSEADFMTDDGASQAILSSGEEEADVPEVTDSSAISQLVMPSLSMPSRRPFTEKGKGMGRLKILIAGDSAVGKTSLIKAIVQMCDDIVHVDPLCTPSPSAVQTYKKNSKSKFRKGSPDISSTSHIAEIYASTRAYPHWWSEIDEGKLLRRRKSTGDTVLERNICFVDTPGYSNGTSFLETITPVIQYVEAQVERSLITSSANENDLISMLGGNGGHQVDVVFYIFHRNLKAVDIEYLRRLAPLTNIIPLIAHADTLTHEQLDAIKADVSSGLTNAGIRTFNFHSSGQHIPSQQPSLPYSISTLADSDHDNMDASLLMSSDYIQPLVPTELSALVEQVFQSDSIAWLRHSAARKSVQWRKGTLATSSQTLPRPLSLSSSATADGSQILRPPMGATNTYALARVADHMQREDRLAQVRLSNWATELQRSIQNERRRFEALARGERAVWLTERLSECVQDGTLVPLSEVQKNSDSRRAGPVTRQGNYSRKGHRHNNSLDRHDPLGLVQLNAEMQRRTWAALQIVGSFGIIGGVALWFARSWNPESDSINWGVDWTRLMADW